MLYGAKAGGFGLLPAPNHAIPDRVIVPLQKLAAREVFLAGQPQREEIGRARLRHVGQHGPVHLRRFAVSCTPHGDLPGCGAGMSICSGY